MRIEELLHAAMVNKGRSEPVWVVELVGPGRHRNAPWPGRTRGRGTTMTGYNRGRATLYKGIRMRSRLEASFAAKLDSIDVKWTYEPQCFADGKGQYLPDFLVTDPNGAHEYVEVKPPTAETGVALQKMHIIRASEPGACFSVWVPTGVYPNQGWTSAARCLLPEGCVYCTQPTKTFIDARCIPPTDPTTGRATIGGRARRDPGEPRQTQGRSTISAIGRRPIPTDPTTGRATIGGRARRDATPIEPHDNWCGQCEVEPCVCTDVHPWDLDDDPGGAWGGI